MAPVPGSPERDIDRPHHHMWDTGTYFVIAARAPVGLEGTRRRDRTNFVLVAVGPDLQPNAIQ
jgi:hypothetical protein